MLRLRRCSTPLQTLKERWWMVRHRDDRGRRDLARRRWHQHKAIHGDVEPADPAVEPADADRPERVAERGGSSAAGGHEPPARRLDRGRTARQGHLGTKESVVRSRRPRSTCSANPDADIITIDGNRSRPAARGAARERVRRTSSSRSSAPRPSSRRRPAHSVCATRSRPCLSASTSQRAQLLHGAAQRARARRPSPPVTRPSSTARRRRRAHRRRTSRSGESSGSSPALRSDWPRSS